ncbi:MAG: glycosyltransferase family 2 protein [Leptolyngbyaceae cyanobacterium SM1_1_3]|nr:glycosyltransferase family 2 protein [Leptolyngbyaceae cyanobacterium SM1_1_3]NJN01615.1 glycosyltransferase family 2 protein [Leptolyngbyaceae cyanobacterium RM1_1_2]NJO09860.1 glycosyltransferase family 2 protein [Leptolyngbyaceae cyanobacterium SL_1_1]
MPKPQISAIICTHNRAIYLGAAIDSLLRQTFVDYEVIVVDNASNDQTQSVVEARLQDSRLKYLYEPQLGLSVARNTGAIAAQAEILAYLDDDAEASENWLSALHTVYQENSQLAIAGGKVTLIWPPQTAPPRWLAPELAASLGAYDLGERLVYIEQSGLTPRGLNYSVRKQFLQDMGGFDPNLGRIGKNLLSNEEMHLTELALQAGKQVAYVPQALVAHNVAPDRLKPSWHLNRSWWQGISECYREQVAGCAGFVQIQRGSERLLRGSYKVIKYCQDPAKRFANLAYAYGQIGYLLSALQGMLRPEKIKRSA